MPDREIRNWRRLDHRLTSSGQPDAEQLAALRALGVAHVINLAPHDHPDALPGEAARVAALGMTYIHIPVAFDAPTEADYARFAAAMAGIGEEPVHVHCMVNARVSAFLYRWRRDLPGVGEARARAEMETLWKPGGVWAAFLGDADAVDLPHRWTGIR